MFGFRVDVDAEALRWTPVLSGPASLYGSPYKRDGGPFFVARSPPPNMSNQRKQQKEEKSSSESSCDEEEVTPVVVKNRKQSFEKVSNKKNLKKVRKNLHSEEEKQKSRPKTPAGKKADEKLKKGKKGRKKKSGGETSTSSSDENKKHDDSVSSSSSEDSSTSSEEDEKEEKNVRNRKNFGHKGSTVATPSSAKRQSTGVNKKSNKRSGEYEGLDGGEKNNIFTNSKTTTTSRHQTNQDVAKVRDRNESAKMRLVAASKVSSSELVKDPEETGILNRAIDRLFELRQNNDSSKMKADDREANDADVEDEVDEKIVKLSDKASPSNGKVSLNFESPTKKLKKRSPELANRRFRRAAASKASDRIARESRGSINLDTSSSSDSEDSLPKNKIDKKKPVVETLTNKLSAKKTSLSSIASTSEKPTPTVTKSLNSKLGIFNKRFERVVSKAEVISAIIPHSESSDFEDENVTLASKFKKGVKSVKKINAETKLSANKKKAESSSTTTTTTASKRKRDEDSGLSDDIDVGKKKQQQQIGIGNNKSNVSGKKTVQDQEKENQFNREAVVANGKNLSWPEQIARSKAARSGSTDKRRLSFDDSADSADPDRSIVESTEPKQSSAPIPKKAIILPILGKHHKEAMLRAAAAKEEQVQKTSILPEAASTAMKGTRPVPAIISPDVETKKRGPGRPRKVDSSITGYEI